MIIAQKCWKMTIIRYGVTVRQTDAAGNESAISEFDFTVDTAVPVAPVFAGIIDDTGEVDNEPLARLMIMRWSLLARASLVRQ